MEEQDDDAEAQQGQTELAGVGLPTQEAVVVAGRVCVDGEGKLNAKSVLLEVSVQSRLPCAMLTSAWPGLAGDI